MSDYASIIGGNAPDSLVGQMSGLDDVGRDWNAIYHIQSADVFLDRFDTSGMSIVDATDAAGAVRVEVGSGADTVNTGAGSDSVWAGAGRDSVDAGQGDNTVAGGQGDDAIRTWGGRDSIAGGEGDDTIFAGSGDDYVVGGAGDDSISGEDGNDSLFGSSGDDTLLGGLGQDSLVGGSGADFLAGGAGDDTMFGGSGGDVFAFDSGFGQDVISDFGAGDKLQFAADINGSGIASATDVAQFVSGGTTASGTKFTVISINGDTVRLEKVDHNDFVNQIGTWVQVG